MPQQIFIVHGGDVQSSYEGYLEYLRNYQVNLEKVKYGGWKDYLQEKLGEDFEVIYPQMENYHNAKYAEWKIFFERFFEFLRDDIIFLGGSLGGIFLAKYLSENDFPVKIKAVFLVAAPYDSCDGEPGHTLGDFSLSESLEKFEKQAGKIFLYHSKDDPMVPFADLQKYADKLSGAEKVIFENRGHFILRDFPEIIEKIKSIK